MTGGIVGQPWALIRSYLVVACVMAGDGLIAFCFPPYLRSLDVPIDIIGLLIAAGGLAALASRLPGGMLYRGSRARAMLVGAALASAVAAFLLPRVEGPLAFAALRMVGGFAYGVATTTNMARFIEALPPGVERARAMGYFSAALAFGLVFGNGLGGFFGEWFGFGAAFQVAAVAQLLAGALSLTLPRPATVERKAPPAQRGPAPSGWQRLAALAEPGMLTVVLAAFLGAFMQQISGSFLPLFGLSVGLALAEVAAVRMVAGGTNVFARGMASPLTQRFGRHRIQHVGLALQAAGLVALSFGTNFWGFLGAMLWVATWRAIVLVANTISLTEDVDEQQVSRGLGAGLFNAAIDVGNLCAPALGGVVAAQWGLPTMFRVLPPFVLALYYSVMLARARFGPRMPPVAAVKES